ncbi:LysR family transcriptional regulator [Noviherbaspirillum aerium]|uniref:LysR family transcriptional regulator n=1 Tax=Noviherbaspirillum aerium TaxID=2588497 RepID=UPI00124E243A|nr:LysR family transcriptional regulator [Noviherbaspirillum aerium]
METPHWFVRNRLKTRQLWLIVAIYDHKSINKAAEVLGMTQPASSKLLREIEEVLGVALFERLPRGMQATWYGETMVRHARMVLRGLNTAWDEIADWKSGRSGRVTVGSIMAPAISMVPRAIEAFYREDRMARVSVVVESSDVLFPRLAQGEIDIMIGRFVVDGDKTNYDYETLVDQEAICFVARRDHPWQKRRKLSWQTLSEAAWVVPPPGGRLRHRFDMLFREQDVSPPRRLVETVELQTLAALVQRTDMLAILPTEAARHCAGSNLRILPLQLSCTMDSFGIITRRGHLLSPTAAELLGFLRTAAQTHYGGMAVKST